MCLRTLAQRPRGLILFVGRTSAGKSTTMAAMLQHINLNAAAHIVRIEDPL
ncbi:MAG: ATPase, T2SS/T4P/T4SS family, partial [Betaproteobacteria bacterium]